MRTSVVGQAKLNAVIFASTVFVGDLAEFAPVTYALAVQRQRSVFAGNEGDFSKFPAFSTEVPKPAEHHPVPVITRNVSPFIHVNGVRIISVSTSSLFQIGSNQSIRSMTKLKHIRQLIRGEMPVQHVEETFPSL